MIKESHIKMTLVSQGTLCITLIGERALFYGSLLSQLNYTFVVTFVPFANKMLSLVDEVQQQAIHRHLLNLLFHIHQKLVYLFMSFVYHHALST